MKTKYQVQKINWTDPEPIKNAEYKICFGLKEVFAYCGGKLKRSGWGYAGCSGNTGYVATRI